MNSSASSLLGLLPCYLLTPIAKAPRGLACALSCVALVLVWLVSPATAQLPQAPYQIPQPASFASGQGYTVGPGPQDATVGDFNGDGRPDMVVANIDSTFSVLLNNGDGTFQPAQTYFSGLSVGCGVVSADLNGDGKVDLIFSDCTVGGNVSVAFGNGDGTFQAANIVLTGLGAWLAAVGDFNSDGKIDVAGVTGGSNGTGVVVLLGDGKGGFQTPVSYDVGHLTNWILAADMNKDGNVDLVTTSSDGTVSVLLGNGDGSFQTASTFALTGLAPGTAGSPASPAFPIAIGDFNGDGKPDLVVMNDGQYSPRLGTGDGITFASPFADVSNTVQFAVNPQLAGTWSTGILTASSAILGDFNGDGNVDYAFGGSTVNDSETEIGLGGGDGNFWVLLHDHNTPPGSWDTMTNNCCNFGSSGPTIDYGPAPGIYTQWLRAADFNGDGKLDLAAIRTSTPGVVTIYLNTTPRLNTNFGTNVAAKPVDTSSNMSPVSLSFSDVTQPGMTTLTTSGTGASPPSGFQLGTPAIYYNLKTTATFSGAVSVCVNYAGTTFSNQTDLHLFHYEGGAWVDVTTSLDTAHTTICGSVSSFSPFAVARALYSAQVQQPINGDGSSVFSASKGVVPVKFSLTLGNVATCSLPTATLAVIRTSGGAPGSIDESLYTLPSDNGIYFRASGCQYVYNLSSKSLGAGSYRVDIMIGNTVVGSGFFGLK